MGDISFWQRSGAPTPVPPNPILRMQMGVGDGDRRLRSRPQSCKETKVFYSTGTNAKHWRRPGMNSSRCLYRALQRDTTPTRTNIPLAPSENANRGGREIMTHTQVAEAIKSITFKESPSPDGCP